MSPREGAQIFENLPKEVYEFPLSAPSTETPGADLVSRRRPGDPWRRKHNLRSAFFVVYLLKRDHACFERYVCSSWFGPFLAVRETCTPAALITKRWNS